MNAVSVALYALEQFPPAEKKPAPTPPPKAEVITRDDVARDEVNLASARF
jgi:hypothetical protein